MKKSLVFVSGGVLLAGACCWLYKNRKEKYEESVSSDEKMYEADITGNWEDDIDYEMNLEQEKNNKAQSFHERHADAAGIMKETYSSIMEDFMEEDAAAEKQNEDVWHVKSSVTEAEMDEISEELDKLLKKD